MIYNNVADIFAANEDVRQRIVTRVAGLDVQQQNFRPAQSAWSVAEIVEHLSIIEGNMVRLVSKLLTKIESEAAAPRPMPPFSLDEHTDSISTKKLEAPAAIRP